MKVTLENNEICYTVFLALLAATPPLSTDMYLAAIPRIAQNWGVGKDLVNLTLVLWFAAFSIFILVAGSLSDKYGRKPLLIAGLIIFIVSSLLCSISQNVYQLIIFRVFQGMGAGAPSAIIMAIIRDRFTGTERQKALAYVMIIVAVAPMVAPIIGALLMEFYSWRFIFLIQGIVAFVSLMITFSFQETLQEKLSTRLLRLITRYTVHFQNKEFMVASLSMGILALPFFGFIAFSPIYYIAINGLSEKMFSLFFGLNALSSMMGAYASSRIANVVSDKTAITLAVIGCMLAGLGVSLLAREHYLYFLIFMGLFSFCTGVSRPISAGLILGLVKTDVGSAASFLVFYQFISGAACMAFVTQPWRHPVLMYSLLTFSVSFLVLMLWLKISKTFNPVY